MLISDRSVFDKMLRVDDNGIITSDQHFRVNNVSYYPAALNIYRVIFYILLCHESLNYCPGNSFDYLEFLTRSYRNLSAQQPRIDRKLKFCL